MDYSTYLKKYPSENGFFGKFGGAYLPPQLVPAMEEITQAYLTICHSSQFINELRRIRREFQGRPTPVYHCENLSRKLGNCQIYLKREDLNHSGAHKLNHCMGEGLLAKFMGKKRIIAETGAGQHGVALATAAAFFGLDCTIYMGEVDVKKQAPNVARMKILGAEVLKDTISNIESIQPRKQIESEATVSRMITKEIQKISWQKSAKEIHNLIRALNSHPGAISNFKNRDGKIETFKIWKSRVVDNEIPHEIPGKILKRDGFYVATGAGSLEILEIQAQGSRRMSIQDFLRGHDLSEGVFE